MEGFLNTLLSTEADSVCGAAYGSRDPERTNRRNGYRHRDLDTRTGTLDVALRKLREGSYFSDWLLERRHRAEAVMAKDLDELVRDFRKRPLDAGHYTFLAADALTMKVREGGRVVKIAVMVATGVNVDGYREVLGSAVGDSETQDFWTEFLRGLRGRGLHGVQLVISDHHRGLMIAIDAVMGGASWQRCREHYADLRIMPM